MNDDALKEMAREITRKCPQHQSIKDVVLVMEIVKALRIVRDDVIKRASQVALTKGYTFVDEPWAKEGNAALREQNKYISDNIKELGK